MKYDFDCVDADFAVEGKVATVEDAARADEDPPLDQLIRVMKNNKGKVEKGESIVYWMRMEDVRSETIIDVPQ
jgi:deoxyribodipyrimidine photo-lyase